MTTNFPTAIRAFLPLAVVPIVWANLWVIAFGLMLQFIGVRLGRRMVRGRSPGPAVSGEA